MTFEMFDSMGAERARAELLAIGERARSAEPHHSVEVSRR
jgi:hypothetical protein